MDRSATIDTCLIWFESREYKSEGVLEPRNGSVWTNRRRELDFKNSGDFGMKLRSVHKGGRLTKHLLSNRRVRKQQRSTSTVLADAFTEKFKNAYYGKAAKIHEFNYMRHRKKIIVQGKGVAAEVTQKCMTTRLHVYLIDTNGMRHDKRKHLQEALEKDLGGGTNGIYPFRERRSKLENEPSVTRREYKWNWWSRKWTGIGGLLLVAPRGSTVAWYDVH